MQSLWPPARSSLASGARNFAGDSAARQLEIAGGRGTARVAAQGVLGPLSVGRCDKPVFPAVIGGMYCPSGRLSDCGYGPVQQVWYLDVNLDDARYIRSAVFGYPRTRLITMSKTSLPPKLLHLRRQQKVDAYDGKSDGKGPCRSQPNPLTTRACATC